MSKDYLYKGEKLLLVDRAPDKVFEWLKEWTKDFNVSIYIAKSGFEALIKYKENNPRLILIACDLPDINGMSLSSIIKDGVDGHNVTIYLYNLDKILTNTKADASFLNMDNPQIVEEQMKNHVINFYKRQQLLQANNNAEIIRARNSQYKLLSQEINNKFYSTINIFSAFNLLSGDTFNYWADEEGNLYGILIDCTGHDMESFSQVRATLTLLKSDFRMYEFGVTSNLSEILKSVNSDLYAVNMSPDPVSVILFKVDVTKGLLYLCPAGVPGIFVKKVGASHYELCEFSNFILGFIENPEFDEYTLPLTDVDSVVICTDGLWEVTYNNEDINNGGIAKHDDVSGVIVNFKEAIHSQFKENISGTIEMKPASPHINEPFQGVEKSSTYE